MQGIDSALLRKVVVVGSQDAIVPGMSPTPARFRSLPFQCLLRPLRICTVQIRGEERRPF